MAGLKKVFIVLLIAGLVLSAGCTFQNREAYRDNDSPQNRVLAHVIRVVDGDTAYVRFPNGTVEKVRFLGVDTPETEVDKNKPNEYDHITDMECLTEWGLRAKEFTEKALQGKEVYLVFDPISPRRDYYGRLLAYIYLQNGTDFTAELVRLGYARVYIEGKFEKKGAYLEEQERAMGKGLGLWVCMPGQATKSIIILTVVYDAPGDDSTNLNGEYVVLKNIGKTPVNLRGWKIEDSDGNAYTFPDIILEPGGKIKLYSGSGMNNSTDLYWGSEVPVWDNDGDTVYLYNERGNLVDSYSWAAS
ncbi:lamin tail domain-containing protein [Thermococcus zilligii]|uniref:lamin tail domain-containing protein n=1 Tax=Thermococcus zilligii TaxID=54076 RepID=UPI001ED93FC0|nr:lamin tail domain-containing protein [Thermococcus zilligii]